MIEEYKTCHTCRHYEKSENEYPCTECRYGIPPANPKQKTAPLKWESNGGAGWPVPAPDPCADRAPDMVNHPAHYETGRFECIDVMVETQGAEAVKEYCLCAAFKYLYRHKHKNGVEDIKKATWYLQKYLELEGELV